MVSFILDASAVLRFIDREAGAERVSEVFQAALAGRAVAIMSAIHYGEVIGVSYRRGGSSLVQATAARLAELEIQVVSVDQTQAGRAAVIHVSRKIPYADSFAVELASQSPDHILITADFDFKLAEQDVTIEFLPRKSTI
jgi:PIN domain nuclease of toxin-antitoxin system